FTDLPLDVFLEVAPHLYPLDVINLSRTSKPLRSLLMSRGSRPIWTTALGNIVELPPCPTDMSEPLYAALVFDHHCFVSRDLAVLSNNYQSRLIVSPRPVASATHFRWTTPLGFGCVNGASRKSMYR
ncbi:hypothetical protein LXA43DRAFT_893524, partial [Ganoderma leucocontextum]